MSLGLNLAEYANSAATGGNGQSAILGGSSAEELNQLNKALEAGSITGRDTANLSTASGAPLKVESLDKTLKHLTFRESEIVLWKKIQDYQATNDVHEF